MHAMSRKLKVTQKRRGLMSEVVWWTRLRNHLLVGSLRDYLDSSHLPGAGHVAILSFIVTL